MPAGNAVEVRIKAEAYDREQAERLRRQQSALQSAELDKARLAVEAELARLKQETGAAHRKREAQAGIEVLEAERAAANRQAQVEVELLEARQRIWASFNAIDRLNDKVSAVRYCIPPGYRVRLHQDSNYSGTTKDLIGTGAPTSVNLNNWSFGDKTSSAQWLSQE